MALYPMRLFLYYSTHRGEDADPVLDQVEREDEQLGGHGRVGFRSGRIDVLLEHLLERLHEGGDQSDGEGGVK